MTDDPWQTPDCGDRHMRAALWQYHNATPGYEAPDMSTLTAPKPTAAKPAPAPVAKAEPKPKADPQQETPPAPVQTQEVPAPTPEPPRRPVFLDPKRPVGSLFQPGATRRAVPPKAGPVPVPVQKKAAPPKPGTAHARLLADV